MNDRRNGWHTAELLSHVAVYPDYEDGHVLSASGCWCEPRITHEDPETGEPYRLPLVVHRDIAERSGAGAAITDFTSSG